MPDVPERGIVFWPVGCGDSTTIVVNDDTVIQVDLHHVAESESDSDDRAPIVDLLIDLLPKQDGKPYLAAFGATHLDEDHICGFQRLLDEVTIGDLWFTPRILWEQDQDELVDDAKAFVAEAERRIEKVKNQQAESGDRVRVIGYMEAVREHYDDVPDDSITVPGNAFTAIDGVDLEGVFRAFVHAPFKDDGEGERNDTSFALHVTLAGDDGDLRALMFGDLTYPTLKRIFDRSADVDLEWDILLAPHHCSKYAMYQKEDGTDVLYRDILNAMESARVDGGYVVASSIPVPSSDEPGANPPHHKAAQRYREIVSDGHFLVTGEAAPDVVAFVPGSDGPQLAADLASGTSMLAAAIAAGRGDARPTGKRVGFGWS